MINSNWKSCIQNVQTILVTNKNRVLNLLQKSYFINTYAFSKIWYLAQTLPLPKEQGKRLESIAGFFSGLANRKGSQEVL